MFNVVTEKEWVEEGVGAVVLIAMFRSNNELYPLAKAQLRESFLIGDASAPRTIHEAILEGHRAAGHCNLRPRGVGPWVGWCEFTGTGVLSSEADEHPFSWG
jgi:hypothetical protein